MVVALEIAVEFEEASAIHAGGGVGMSLKDCTRLEFNSHGALQLTKNNASRR